MRQSKQKKELRLVRDISETLGKLPPQAIDIEEAVLGAMMLENDKLFEVIDKLSPDDFYLEQHQHIFTSCLSLYNERKPVDMRTVIEKLRSIGLLDLCGGAWYIAELVSKVSSSANIIYHATIIIERKIKRDIITIASSAHEEGYDDTSDAFDVLANMQSRLDAIGGKYLKGNFQSAGEISKKLMTKLAQRIGDESVTGVPSGFTFMDRVLGGWQKTDLIVVAARPGMGKTALLLSSAISGAMENKIPIAIFSLEMGSEQLMTRAFSGLAEIENTKIFKNFISEDDLLKIETTGASPMTDAPLYIDDTPAISITEFRARARRLVHEYGVKAIFLDYIQLMKGDESATTRDAEIGTITGCLKAAAKELDIPVIAMCQLSRAVESRSGEKKPQLSDLRESGNIEQDADIVIFLYRPEYYGIKTDEKQRSTEGLMQVIVAKHRNGGLDTIPLKFVHKFTKVVDYPTETILNTAKQAELPLHRELSKASVQNDDVPF